jgi:hypothetical protein
VRADISPVLIVVSCDMGVGLVHACSKKRNESLMPR